MILLNLPCGKPQVITNLKNNKKIIDIKYNNIIK